MKSIIRRPFRPSFEVLEDRLTPSAITPIQNHTETHQTSSWWGVIGGNTVNVFTDRSHTQDLTQTSESGQDSIGWRNVIRQNLMTWDMTVTNTTIWNHGFVRSFSLGNSISRETSTVTTLSGNQYYQQQDVTSRYHEYVSNFQTTTSTIDQQNYSALSNSSGNELLVGSHTNAFVSGSYRSTYHELGVMRASNTNRQITDYNNQGSGSSVGTNTTQGRGTKTSSQVANDRGFSLQKQLSLEVNFQSAANYWAAWTPIIYQSTTVDNVVARATTRSEERMLANGVTSTITAQKILDWRSLNIWASTSRYGQPESAENTSYVTMRETLRLEVWVTNTNRSAHATVAENFQGNKLDRNGQQTFSAQSSMVVAITGNSPALMVTAINAVFSNLGDPAADFSDPRAILWAIGY